MWKSFGFVDQQYVKHQTTNTHIRTHTNRTAVNHLKRSGVRWLHLKVFSAMV